MSRNVEGTSATGGIPRPAVGRQPSAVGPRPRDSFFLAVHALVRQVPRGKVVSYGQVAAMLGAPRNARAVGYALHALRFDRPEDGDVPWQRVINSRGRISFRGDDVRGVLQERLLAEEGVEFNADGVVDWVRYGWMVLPGKRPVRGGPRTGP